MPLNSAEVNSGQSDELARVIPPLATYKLSNETRVGRACAPVSSPCVSPPLLTTLSRDNVLFMSCALSSDSPFHIIPPRVLESRERLRHVTVIIFLSADKDMDCRGSALILHAPLPTSTLCLFSTEAKVNQPAWWLVRGATLCLMSCR